MSSTHEGEFNPAVYVAGLVKKAMGDGVPRRCSAEGMLIIIAPKQSVYYVRTGAALDELRRFCLLPPFDLRVEPLTGWTPPKPGQETLQVGRMRLRKQADNMLDGLSPRPLAELLWLSVSSASVGRLLQGCRTDEPVRLNRLPDFNVLPHREGDTRLAQFMLEASADLLTVAKRTGIPLAQVIDFHNACALLGLVERGNVFDPAEHFLGLVQQSLRDGLMRRCLLPGLPPLFLAPQEGRYYCQGEHMPDLTPWHGAGLVAMQVELADGLDQDTGEGEEEVIQVGRMQIRRKKEALPVPYVSGPLEELLWGAALTASRGRLLAGANADATVRLRRWPDFARLSRDRRYLPLAAFMSVNAADLRTVAKHTGAPLSQVVDFHNACAVLGLLEQLPEQRLQKRPVSDRERETYRSISLSLGNMWALAYAS